MEKELHPRIGNQSLDVITTPSTIQGATTSTANPESASSSSTLFATPTNEIENALVELLGPYPYNAPEGYNGWKLEPVVVNTTFGTLYLKKLQQQDPN